MSLEASVAYSIAHKVIHHHNLMASAAIQQEYDIIIIGGGSAGCVLANRLSGSEQKYTVLLVEAGESSLKVLFSYLPGAYGQMFHNEKWDYNYFTVPQKGCHGRKMFQPRTDPDPVISIPPSPP
jgi:choline dehydrogenase